MSVDGEVLGAAGVAGIGATVIADLANTGSPEVIGISVAAITLIVLGVIARFAGRR